MLKSLFCLGLVLFAGPAQAGYTHYWNFSRPPSAESLRDCTVRFRKLTDARPKLLHLYSAAEWGEADPPAVAFNGIGADEHEPFIFPGKPGFNFCKTDAKPYDEVVTAVLIAARDCFPAEVLGIGSDGDWSDWSKGAALYEEVFQHTAKNPLGGRVAENDSSDHSAVPGPSASSTLARVIPLAIAALLIGLYLFDKRRRR